MVNPWPIAKTKPGPWSRPLDPSTVPHVSDPGAPWPACLGAGAGGRRAGARAGAGGRVCVCVDRSAVFVIRDTNTKPRHLVRAPWCLVAALGSRAVGRAAWAVGRVARFARRAARGLVPK